MIPQTASTISSSPVAVYLRNNNLDSLPLTKVIKSKAIKKPLQMKNENTSKFRPDRSTLLCNQKSGQKNPEPIVLSDKRKKRVTFLAPEYIIIYELSNKLENNISEVDLHETARKTEFTNKYQHGKDSSTSKFDCNSNTKDIAEVINNKDEYSVNYLIKNNVHNKDGLHVRLRDKCDTVEFHQMNDQHSTYNENREKLRVQLEAIFSKVTEKHLDTILKGKSNDKIITNYKNSKDIEQMGRSQHCENHLTDNLLSHGKLTDSKSMKNRSIDKNESNYNQGENLRMLSTQVTKVVNELRELLCGTWPLKSSHMLDVQKFAYQKGLEYRQEYGELYASQKSWQSQNSSLREKNVKFRESTKLPIPFETSTLNLNRPSSTELRNSEFSSIVSTSSEDNLSFENIRKSAEKQLDSILRKRRDMNDTRSLSASSSPVKGLDRCLYPNKTNVLENLRTNKFVPNHYIDSFLSKPSNRNWDKTEPEYKAVITSLHALNNKSNEFICQSNHYNSEGIFDFRVSDSHNKLDKTFNHFNSYVPEIQNISKQKRLVNICTSPIDGAENTNHATVKIPFAIPSQNLLELTNNKIEDSKTKHRNLIEFQKWNYSRRLSDSSFDIDVDGFADGYVNHRNRNIKCAANNLKRYVYNDRLSSFFDCIYIPGNNSQLNFKENDRNETFIESRRSRTASPDIFPNNFSSLDKNNPQMNSNEWNEISNFTLPRFFIESDLKGNRIIPSSFQNAYHEWLFRPSEENFISTRLDTPNLSSRRYNQRRWQTIRQKYPNRQECSMWSED
ncbi:putative ccaat-box DNA binding protein subunit B [Schistosoma mansoni]|uniref:putative ccaat-box DNA binding protein subunit B n=1 Tax=Schistosoma mansoni TaxID=6183 RepID=UPI0001A62BD6|nr:putative ccaat-box DNA binding protein subunit B [Schistosoma mansoni]|eukprot:XP_018651431.1 putative ccaat-box DNA binding protein subunit B [Schistosoma mansoni]